MRRSRSRHPVIRALAALAALTAAAPASAGWDHLFRTAQYYDEGWNTTGYRYGSPYGLAVADFNGDGRPDIAVADAQSGPGSGPGISVLMHTGSSMSHQLFTSEWREGLPTAQPAYGIATADFNSDGRPDIVVGGRANPLNMSVISVRQGTATGFGPPKIYTPVSGTGTVATGDVNADGLPDVVVGGLVDGSAIIGIEVMTSVNGDSLAAPLLYPVPDTSFQPNPVAMVLADATGDGALDVVVTVMGEVIGPCMYVLRNNGIGGYLTVLGPIALDDASTGVVVGHLNGDAIPDIAVTSALTHRVSVYYGSGGGVFQAPVHHAAGPYPGALCAGDIDADGDEDLVAVTKQSSNIVSSVTVLRNNGNGTFATAAIYGGLPGSGQASLADVDLDGGLDIVASVFAGGSDARTHEVGVLRNDGSGGFIGGIAGVEVLAATREAVGDFNRDGYPDLVIATPTSVDFAAGNGDGTFDLPTLAMSWTNVQRLLPGDLDRDGKLDLVVGDGVSGVPSIGSGTGTFAILPSPGLGPPVALVDMNRDGALDILTASSGSLTPRLNSGTPSPFFVSRPSVAVTVGNSSAATGDWNRDGIMDVAVVGTGGLATLLGLPNGDLAAEVVIQTGRNYTAVCATDVNRDGILDLAAREDTGGLTGVDVTSRGLDVFLGSSNGAFGPARSFGTLERRGTTIAALDANLDGMPDLITSGVAGAINGATALSSFDLHVGTGTGDVAQRVGYSVGTLTPNGAPQRPLTVGDVDRNSVPDVLSGVMGGATGTTVHTVLARPPARGNGLQDAAFFPTLSFPIAAAIGDLNRDGNPDVVATAHTTNPGVAVLLGNGDGTLGTSTTLAQSWFTRRVEVADFNRDGILDIAASNPGFGAPRVSTMLGVGDGTFGARNDYYVIAGNDFEVGDMNRDGIPDIVTIAQDSIRVLIGTGTGTFTAGASVELNDEIIYDLDLADLDRDGFLDIAVAASEVRVVYGATGGTLGAPVTLAAPISSSQSLCVADFNRDGFLDIVTHHGSVWYVLWGEAAAPFSTYVATTLLFEPFNMTVGEAAANGAPYVYASRNITGLEVISVSPAGAMAVVGSYDVTSTPFGLALGDLNRDGGLDVVTAGVDESLVSVNLHGNSTITGIGTPPPAGDQPLAALRNNAPNPFNPSTMIRFWLREPDHARLDVYDVRGRLVTTLAEGTRAAGDHVVRWDGQDLRGSVVASGVYFYRLATRSGHAEAKRMVLVK